MMGLVVPFRGPTGKSRLALPSEESRSVLALAMLADVLETCVAVGPSVVVGDGAVSVAAHAGAAYLDDPGGGQGAAVAAALERIDPAPALVVNADLPCARPHDLRELLRQLPPGGVALAEAADGTTNALALARADLFAPLYGPGSAGRFRERARRLGVEAVSVRIPNLADDVDTVEDAERLEPRVGRRTRKALASLVELAR